MKFSNAVVVGVVCAITSGCAYLPEGFPSRNVGAPTESLFVGKEKPTAKNIKGQVADSSVNDSGLRIRKSKRGNMQSYVVRGQRYFTMDSSDGYSARGVASWYGPNFHGRTASNGEVYDMYRLTAAHKTLPLPTYAKVSHLENGRSVIVKINDRGPFSGDRIIDMSFAAALRLGMINDGTAMVEVQALSPEEMMALSGPENKLGIDFYTIGEEQVADAAPAVQGDPEAETIVAAVSLEDEPITPMPITDEETANSLVEPKVQQENLATTDELLNDDLQTASGDATSDTNLESAKLSLAASDDAAALPVVADAVQSGIAPVTAAVQTVNLPTGKDRSGYFIQAGVFPDVLDAERLAVDVVLAAPGEEVNVKPLKDTDMYRITVGPIVTRDHANKVSGLLSAAGLDNFTVKVK